MEDSSLLSGLLSPWCWLGWCRVKQWSSLPARPPVLGRRDRGRGRELELDTSHQPQLVFKFNTTYTLTNTLPRPPDTVIRLINCPHFLQRNCSDPHLLRGLGLRSVTVVSSGLGGPSYHPGSWHRTLTPLVSSFPWCKARTGNRYCHHSLFI